MPIPLMLIFSGIMLATMLVLARAYYLARGVRVITCPDNHRPAAVNLNAKYVALTALVDKPNLVLKNCSRWPEMRNCGQQCLRQIEQAPDGCLLTEMLAHWYQDKSCQFCHHPINFNKEFQHRAALMTPAGETIEWQNIAAEKIPDVMQTHLPVCWNCHIAESFRHDFPDLVTDNPYPHGIKSEEKVESSQ